MISSQHLFAIAFSGMNPSKYPMSSFGKSNEKRLDYKPKDRTSAPLKTQKEAVWGPKGARTTGLERNVLHARCFCSLMTQPTRSHLQAFWDRNSLRILEPYPQTCSSLWRSSHFLLQPPQHLHSDLENRLRRKKNCEDRVHSCSYLARQKGLLTIKNPSASPIKDSGVWAKHNDFWDAYRRRRTRPTHWETKLSLQYRLWKSTPLLETHIASVLIEKLLYSRINLSGKRQQICHQK